MESRLIFIDYRVDDPVGTSIGPGRSATGRELEFVVARRGSREILEYNELPPPRNRLLLENRTKCSLWVDTSMAEYTADDLNSFCPFACIYLKVNRVKFNFFFFFYNSSKRDNS